MDWANIHTCYILYKYVCIKFQRINGTTEQELINLQYDGLKQFPDEKIDGFDIYRLRFNLHGYFKNRHY